MTLPTLTLQLTPQLFDADPEQVGTWLRRMSDAYTDIGEADDVQHDDSDEAPPEPDEQAQVDAIVARWRQFAPARAGQLTTLTGSLRALGYTLALSRPRGGGEPRTYLRVLLPDGTNAGYLSSKSFSLVEARDTSLAADPRVTTRTANGTPVRYPRVDLLSQQAFELVVAIAEELLRKRS